MRSGEVALQLETEPEGTMLDIMEHQARYDRYARYFDATRCHWRISQAFHEEIRQNDMKKRNGPAMSCFRILERQGSSRRVSNEQIAADKILDLQKTL